MEALPISTLQLPSPPATAGTDLAAEAGALPAGPDGDFQAVLFRNLAGHASRAIDLSSASAMLAMEDGKGAAPAALFPNLPGVASGTVGQASTLPAAEDGDTGVLALLAAGDKGQAGASLLPALNDNPGVPAPLSPGLPGLSPSHAGIFPDTAERGSSAKDSGASEESKASDEALQDEPAKDATPASDGALALLAALPQPVSRPETRAALPASPALPAAATATAATAATDRNRESIGGERDSDAGPRRGDLARSEAPSVRATQGEPRPGLGLDPDKTVERPARGAETLPDAAPLPRSHGAHAALPVGHAPVAPLGVDPAAAGPAPTHAAVAQRIETPLGAPGWSTALADRVMMFLGDKQQVAELHINPPHLGPVDITLTVTDDRASAIFASPHAVVRETIESALPRLREVLAESGINLGQASVTADSPRDGSAQAQSRSSFGASGHAGADNMPLGAGILAATRQARGLVDLFA